MLFRRSIYLFLLFDWINKNKFKKMNSSLFMNKRNLDSFNYYLEFFVRMLYFIFKGQNRNHTEKS